MLLQRIISGVVLVALLVGTVFFFPIPLVAIIISLLIGSGIWEFYRLAENKGLRPYSIYGIISGAFLCSAIYVLRAKNCSIDTDDILSVILFFILAVTLVKYAFKKDGSSVIINSAVTMLGILYVSFLFTFIIKLRYITNSDAGKGWVMSLFIITKISDICAYFVGTKFGRHKLIPRISANKSLEGASGSVVGSLVVSLLLTQCFLRELTLGMAVLLGLLISIVGQAGDLIESLMKRDAQIKDSGKFVPGLGGVLDFMDSLLFTGPVMYLFFLLIKDRLVI
jgi:phosphatidate cytidylyltransferase